jgi:hypothetical protein
MDFVLEHEPAATIYNKDTSSNLLFDNPGDNGARSPFYSSIPE